MQEHVPEYELPHAWEEAPTLGLLLLLLLPKSLSPSKRFTSVLCTQIATVDLMRVEVRNRRRCSLMSSPLEKRIKGFRHEACRHLFTSSITDVKRAKIL